MRYGWLWLQYIPFGAMRSDHVVFNIDLPWDNQTQFALHAESVTPLPRCSAGHKCLMLSSIVTLGSKKS